MDESSMIARHETHLDKTDVWAALAAPLPADTIAWRQDGRAVERDGRFYARFVAYVDANTVRERLDRVVPGEWDLTLDLLPPLPVRAGAADDDAASCSFKARLQILGVIREDVGTGRDYKAAATDAFKRAAVRFGIAHELYQLEPNWVQVDGEGRWAKPLEEPQAAYARRAGRTTEARTGRKTAASATVNGGVPDDATTTAAVPTGAPAPADVAVPVVVAPEPGPAEPRHDADGFGDETPDCPKCGGRMWDNRLTKRNPKAPDYKCRDRSCDGVVWPPRPAGDGPRDAGRDAPRDAARVKADAPAAPDGPAPEPGPAKRNGTRQRAAAAAGRGEAPLDASPLGASDDDDLPF
jgi:hypothetical protein